MDIYKKDGVKGSRKVDLNPDIFSVEPNRDLIAQYIRVYLFNNRQGTSKTKTRGEVRGGGRKPWRQKGTGRARHGSTRSPIWVGGGVSHGPRAVSRSLKITKNMRRGALFSALSDKANEGKILVIEDFTFDRPNTKKSIRMVDKLPVNKKVLFVLPKVDVNLIKSFSNIPDVSAILAGDLNAYEIVNYNTLVFFESSLRVLEDVFLRSAKKHLS